ncbi:hypothetical protein ACT048_04810 [Ectopseudomonas khazarica]|uniref:hypothetical protein n=1 Tax=Ectopseudomonas khazarica TaxID=2502979 RepID=UPI0040345F8E
MSTKTIQKVAEEATFQVACAMDHLNWLRATLRVLKDRLAQDKAMEHYAALADLAIYNADDWHNQLDVEREVFEKALKAAGGKV